MKSPPDQLAQRLESELGADAVVLNAERLTSHNIDGKQPALVCTPCTVDQVSAALRLCSETAASVIPWGGGTAMALGNPPRQVDVVLDTGRLDRVIDHDHANLTVTAEGGIRLVALQRMLAHQRQFVPFDPPLPERSTVGGIAAANLNGPRRGAYGSVRDLVIGMKVTLIGGEQIKAGGKVVKNVAGYDMCKLFVGSLGTLGIMTEVTLRLAPIPERSATAIVSGDFSHATQLTRELFNSPLLPSAVIMSNEGERNLWRVAIWTEGFEESITRSRRDVTALAARANMNARFLDADELEQFWRAVKDFPLQDKRLIYRVVLPRAEIWDFLGATQNWHDTETITDNASGTIWLACEPTKASVQRFSALATLARTRRGHAVIFAAPGDLKQGFEVWGESPPTFSFMRDIKQQFDPKGLLSPGRFLGGI